MEEIGFFFPSTKGLENKAGVGEEPTTFFSWKRMTFFEAQFQAATHLCRFWDWFWSMFEPKKVMLSCWLLSPSRFCKQKMHARQIRSSCFHPKDQCFLGNHVVNSRDTGWRKGLTCYTKPRHVSEAEDVIFS